MDPLQHATEAAYLHEWEMSLLIAGTPGKPVSAYRQQYRGCLSQSVVNHPVSATHVTAQLLGCRLVADLESGRPDMDILHARELVAAQSSLACPQRVRRSWLPVAGRTALPQRGGLPLRPARWFSLGSGGAAWWSGGFSSFR